MRQEDGCPTRWAMRGMFVTRAASRNVGFNRFLNARFMTGRMGSRKTEGLERGEGLFPARNRLIVQGRWNDPLPLLVLLKPWLLLVQRVVLRRL